MELVAAPDRPTVHSRSDCFDTRIVAKEVLRGYIERQPWFEYPSQRKAYMDWRAPWVKQGLRVMGCRIDEAIMWTPFRDDTLDRLLRELVVAPAKR